MAIIPATNTKDSIPAASGAILVVEDNDTTRQRISRLLEGRGFSVTQATNGRDALNKVVSRRFNAIVLDLLMPEVDGWQFRASQMAHPELARIPTVIVTVRPLREPARYALRADNVIHKPFDDDVLLGVVERACGVSQPTHDVAAETSETALLWSRRGEVACASHAPEITSTRWRDEGWKAIPPRAGMGRVHYQCPQCAGTTTPIGHRQRTDRESRGTR